MIISMYHQKVPESHVNDVFKSNSFQLKMMIFTWNLYVNMPSGKGVITNFYTGL